jgi:creatinine amidohydrolase
MKTSYWQELTSDELRMVDPERTLALLPVAAIEQHGPHLPLCTDAVINDGIVSGALERLPEGLSVLVLPSLNLGHSLEHTGFPGTLSVGAETLLGLWTDVGRCAARCGIRKLVIFNSHGGQTHLVDLAALRLRAELDMLVVRASYFRFGAPDGLFDDGELAHGIHGGEIETSLMLRLRPDLVRRDRLRDFEGLPGRMSRDNALLGPEQPIGFGWMSQDLNPQGVCGAAAHADAVRGAALLEHLLDRLIRLLREVADTPLDVLRPPPPAPGRDT